jgi:2Fe-2S ferredoxin
MPKISFITRAGERRVVDASAGTTIMEAAIDNDVPGIVAECGGACACATCHSYVSDSWLSHLPAMEDMEDAMLDSAKQRRPNSRLTCQIEITDALDGIEVTVADNDN